MDDHLRRRKSSTKDDVTGLAGRGSAVGDDGDQE